MAFALHQEECYPTPETEKPARELIISQPSKRELFEAIHPRYLKAKKTEKFETEEEYLLLLRIYADLRFYANCFQPVLKLV